MTYDPNSNNAVFATIIARLDAQDKTLAAILAQTQKTNGRVTTLENESYANRKITLVLGTILSFIVSAATAWACHHG